jgi:hypothetical protein
MDVGPLRELLAAELLRKPVPGVAAASAEDEMDEAADDDVDDEAAEHAPASAD